VFLSFLARILITVGIREDVMQKNSTKVFRKGPVDQENALSVYLKEINKVDLLTREEEVELATRAKEGDPRAKERLINANLRFVVNVAKKYQNQGLPLDDLISEGNIGLINAIERFEVEKGYHFISYAVWWIRQAILKAICEKSRTIRLPLNRANELVQIEKLKKELSVDNGEEASDKEIARLLGLSENMVRDLINISRDMVSLETPVFDEKQSSTLGDFVEDGSGQTPDALTISDSLKEEINKALATLTDKESQIIQWRFGLNNNKPLSLKEIGTRYNLTKERIRQIEKKALQRLQQPTSQMGLDAYMAS
jgi:RNA polymerase primary sigma factor